MITFPFFLSRFWFLWRQYLTDRDRPDLDHLRNLTDPDRFLWSMLPHAARTFGPCMLLLPQHKAKAAAVGYLYCRCLDTYEDLAPEPGPLLKAFAQRFDEPTPTLAPTLSSPRICDARDEGHLLLVDCIDRIDAVYATLARSHRTAIVRCVNDMARGMQDRSCSNPGDLLTYCRAVIGFPVVFALELLLERDLDRDERETSMRVGEMVQLANVSRDIEKDLERGVVYDRRLLESNDGDTIHAVRKDMLHAALLRATDYRRLMEILRQPRIHLGRASALLMLLFTNRYYDDCARRLGYDGWSTVQSTLGLFAKVLPATFSFRYAMRVAANVEDDMARFCRTSLPPKSDADSIQQR